ncbi:F-box domain-containing protein [Cephalotus follicularis]|uniref:F-box domain-containing protein n=1 Tax=Cephalotus follicularis TaxID=3775 RepID=A0A1Q3B818_CEPFO|nr:F-box domain-containing protein [Cephalotus follicularis]
MAEKQRGEEEDGDVEAKRLYTESILSGKPSFYFGCSLPEIDDIMEQRSSRYVLRQQTPRSLSCISSLENNNMTVIEDPMCKLPEDILCSIISRLSLREAARTSILARRWRHLWKTASSSLDFDAFNMTGNHLGCSQNINIRHDLKGGILEWVNEILQLHCGNKIESFRVEFPWAACLGLLRRIICSSSDIDSWIQFAVKKKARNIDINLFNEMYLEDGLLYEFPYWLFDQVRGGPTIEHLSLTRCAFTLPPNCSCLNSLVSLSLRGTSMEETSLHSILSNCPWLQWLSIKNAMCSNRFTFGSKHSALRLKHVSLYNCPGLQTIEFHNATSLLSFEYVGPMLHLILFQNCAQPIRVSFTTFGGESCALGKLATYFPQIETLLFGLMEAEVDIIPKPIPIFSKLTELVLQVHLSSKNLLELTSSLLKAAPCLVKLELDLPRCCKLATEKIQQKTTNMLQKKLAFEGYCRHERLKEVKLFDFSGFEHDFDLVICLLNNAIALTKIMISRESRFYQGNGEWFIMGMRNGRIGRKQAYEILCKEVPSATRVLLVL